MMENAPQRTTRLQEENKQLKELVVRIARAGEHYLKPDNDSGADQFVNRVLLYLDQCPVAVETARNASKEQTDD